MVTALVTAVTGCDEKDKQSAVETLGYTLFTLSKLMAPFTPFVADELYRRLGGEKESVHLEGWPKAGKADEKVIKEMEEVRKIVELALAKRDEAGIKVRQPLSKLTVTGHKLSEELADLIKDEVNVKEVVFEKADVLSVELDISLTDELKAEGLFRELVRTINQLRKEAKLTINDQVDIYFQTDSELVKKVISQYQSELLKLTISQKITAEKSADTLIDKEASVNGEQVWLGLKK